MTNKNKNFDPKFKNELLLYFLDRNPKNKKAKKINFSNAIFFLKKILIFILTLMKMVRDCLLYTSPSPRDLSTSRMPSSA